MMRRFLALLAALLTLPWFGLADSATWVMVPSVLHPGEKQTLMCSLPAGTNASVAVVDGSGRELMIVRETLTTSSFGWDGFGLAPGTYTLQLRSGLLCAETTITIGDPVPGVELISCDPETSTTWSARIGVTMDGTLTMALDDGRVIWRKEVKAGITDVSWDCTVDGSRMTDGVHEVTFQLDTAQGASPLESVDVTIVSPRLARDAYLMTPADMTGVACPHGDDCYWNLTMGDLDEEAIWKVLTAPITVLTGDERHQVKVRKEPSKSCRVYTGEVTFESQAVHVLERGEEWTLIQAYSSSTEGSSVAVFAKPFTGYVQTSLLRERQVSQKYGVVIDKLQQRLYVFAEGKLLSTLLCSTGYSKKDTPFNETPAGEYICQSWVGGFWSGNLYCDMGIRINDGILLHKVPVLWTTGGDGVRYPNTERCESYLGEKASHGCIRIQRKITPEGVSMEWLWDNLSRDKNAPSKVIIWDEVGRRVAYPEDELTLYYNPDKGKYYHRTRECAGVKDIYWAQMKTFTYGELDRSPYTKLLACPYCDPQLSHEEIDTINKKNNRTY